VAKIDLTRPDEIVAICKRQVVPIVPTVRSRYREGADWSEAYRRWKR
jgi:hypothetical protein